MFPGTLKLETEVKDGVELIHISGPLDSATFDQFKRFMDSIIDQPHVLIVLDGQKLTYVNSRAWILLLHYHRTAMLVLSNFKLAAFNRRSLKSIQLLGLGKYLTWSSTIEEALQATVAI
jgi:anti-anti-sigma factor